VNALRRSGQASRADGDGATAPRPLHAKRPPAPPPPPPRGRAWPVFVVSLAAFFLLYAAWSIATPLFAAPDEPVQVMKAVAVAHGQLLGAQPKGPSSPYTTVHIPEIYASGGGIPGCFAFKNRVPASCAHAFTGTTTDVSVSIYTGRYPPLYYAIVGIPSLFMASASGVYVQRLVSALLNAIFLALAVTAVATWSRSRLLLVGIAAAVTPSALFFGGVVNPSGFEVSCAVCLWSSALVLALERSSDPPPGLVAITALSAAAMALVRGLSPLWVGMIGLSVAGLAGWRAVRELAGYRRVKLAAVVVVLAGGAAVAFILAAHTLDVLPSVDLAPAGSTTGQLFVTTFDHTARFLTEMIGKFGWLDTFAPISTYLVWYGAVGLLAGAAVVLTRRRELAVFVLVALAAVFVPVVISTSQARRAGFVWQGKDSLPFALGVPLVAAALIGQSGVLDRYRGRLTSLVAFTLACGSVVAFAGTLRRYAVGINGPLDFFHTAWRPPLGLAVLLVAELVAAFGTAVLLRNLVEPWKWLARPGAGAGGQAAPPDGEPVDEDLGGGTVESDLAPATATAATAATDETATDEGNDRG
jgi:hypothetical protein